MQNPVDILILTASFGAGHNIVSKAITEQLLSLEPDLNVVTKDLFELIYPSINKDIYKLYGYLINRHASVYNYFYYRRKDEITLLEELVYKSTLKRLQQYLLRFRPRLIVSTFPTCSGLVSRFKTLYGSKVLLVTSITDIVDGSEWIHPNTDKYLIACNEIKNRLISRGLDENLIQVTGIPVRKVFLGNISSNKYSSSHKRKLLVMGGGDGIFNFSPNFFHWLNSLEGVSTTVVMGNNKRMYAALKKDNRYGNITTLGFTENIAELMGQSDLLISKPGGVTIFEALHMELPIIVKAPKLVQEIENAKFIKNAGIGKVEEDEDAIKLQLKKCLLCYEEINSMRRNIIQLKKGICAKEVGSTILTLLYNK